MPMAGGMVKAQVSNRHRRKRVRHELAAEFIGTAIIILFGCGVVAAATFTQASLSSEDDDDDDTFGKMLYINCVWGLGVTYGIMASFDTSGAHLNCAVTLNAMINGDFPLSKGALFMIAQTAGAFFGALLVTINYVVFKGADALTNFYCTAPGAGVTIPNACFNEFIGTFLLQFSIMGITNHHPAFNKFHVAGFVGALVFAIGNAFGPLTGYAINPARDFGPRMVYLIFALYYSDKNLSETVETVMMHGYFMVPIICPCLGAILAGFTYKKFIYIDDGEQAGEAWAVHHLGDDDSAEARPLEDSSEEDA